MICDKIMTLINDMVYTTTDTLNEANASVEIATSSSKHTYPIPIGSPVLGFLHTLAPITPDCRLEK